MHFVLLSHSFCLVYCCHHCKSGMFVQLCINLHKIHPSKHLVNRFSTTKFHVLLFVTRKIGREWKDLVLGNHLKKGWLGWTFTLSLQQWLLIWGTCGHGKAFIYCRLTCLSNPKSDKLAQMIRTLTKRSHSWPHWFRAWTLVLQKRP